MIILDFFTAKKIMRQSQKPTTAPWSRIIAYWRASGVPIRAGATPSSIASFQQKYDVVLPSDFVEYLSSVDGTGTEDSDDSLTSFLPLADVRPVHEALDESGGVVYPDRFAYPDCYVFADHCLSCWFYAVKLTSDPNQSAPVYRVTASKIRGEQMASSFLEFMTKYSNDPESIV